VGIAILVETPYSEEMSERCDLTASTDDVALIKRLKAIVLTGW